MRDEARALLGRHEVGFTEKPDLIFYRRETLPFHANGMRFTAFDAAGAELLTRSYYSVGGGFVVDEAQARGPAQGDRARHHRAARTPSTAAPNCCGTAPRSAAAHRRS